MAAQSAQNSRRRWPWARSTLELDEEVTAEAPGAAITPFPARVPGGNAAENPASKPAESDATNDAANSAADFVPNELIEQVGNQLFFTRWDGWPPMSAAGMAQMFLEYPQRAEPDVLQKARVVKKLKGPRAQSVIYRQYRGSGRPVRYVFDGHDSGRGKGEPSMDWARVLAYVTGTVDQELLARNEYLAAENRILMAQLKGRLKLSDAERATLGEIGHRLGRKVLAEVATVARPDTIQAWYRKLVASKFDGSKARRDPGRPWDHLRGRAADRSHGKREPGLGHL
jgi:hypothetical protein